MAKNNKKLLIHNDFIKLVGDNSDYTQAAIKDILEAVDEVLIDYLAQSDEDTEYAVKVTKNIQVGSKFVPSSIKRNPRTGESVQTTDKLKVYGKFMNTLKDGVNNK